LELVERIDRLLAVLTARDCRNGQHVLKGEQARISLRCVLLQPAKLRTYDIMQHQDASFLFDLDGTLVDSVYQHILA
jgi:hypothetical protein